MFWTILVMLTKFLKVAAILEKAARWLGSWSRIVLVFRLKIRLTNEMMRTIYSTKYPKNTAKTTANNSKRKRKAGQTPKKANKAHLKAKIRKTSRRAWSTAEIIKAIN